MLTGQIVIQCPPVLLPLASLQKNNHCSKTMPNTITHGHWPSYKLGPGSFLLGPCSITGDFFRAGRQNFYQVKHYRGILRTGMLLKPQTRLNLFRSLAIIRTSRSFFTPTVKKCTLKICINYDKQKRIAKILTDSLLP